MLLCVFVCVQHSLLCFALLLHLKVHSGIFLKTPPKFKVHARKEGRKEVEEALFAMVTDYYVSTRFFQTHPFLSFKSDPYDHYISISKTLNPKPTIYLYIYIYIYSGQTLQPKRPYKLPAILHTL